MANYSGFGIDLPFKAASDMNAYQYCFVKLDTVAGANYVDLATGASEPVPLGVLTNDPNVDGAATVRVAGVAKVWISSSTAIQVGNFLMSGSGGQAEVVNSDASAFSGIALEDMTAGCGYMTVLLRPYVSIVSGTT